ncbi:unnamed protein product [Cylindrotheca closterium]|uniref:guanylate cyclase n=1 Tax=Cylindrotheca closterium TaxID=2856 RepID=A0AAD2G6G1_9STRA|nr:unnamed protein product [Cylindrotheca closterium]
MIGMMESSSILLAVGLFLLLAQAVSGTRQLQQQQQCDSCAPPIPFDPSVHKPVYKIALQPSVNLPLMRSLNVTFEDYLTATAGKRFDPPIQFEVMIITNSLAYDLMKSQEIDFIFINPFQSTCLEEEFGAQAIASSVRTTSFGGQKLALAHFAGMVITHVDNNDINTLADLKDKVVAAVSPAALGGPLVQWHEMQKNGMSYLNDPAAIVFTRSMVRSINGVIDKTYDVGFIRTNFMESLKERNPGLNTSAVKVVGIRKDEGTVDEAFPLEHSTSIIPEWRLSAAPSTPASISKEVQAALLALKEHGRTGLARSACLDANGNNTAQCDDLSDIDSQVLCEANIESVSAAESVVSAKEHNTFRTPLSFHRIRKMALDLGSILEDPTSDSLKCFRPSEFYDQIVCQNGLFKLSPDALAASCNTTGYSCPDGRECICKPCFKALAIEVAPTDQYAAGSGCTKMSICSTIVQNEVIQYTVVDNQQLEGGRNLRAKTLEDGTDTEIAIEQGPIPHTYSFSLSTPRVGIFILEIYDGDEQIDASPLRVRVDYRTCSGDKEASEDGVCECKASSIDIGGTCVPIWLAVLVALSPIAIVVAIAVYFFVKRKEREANSLWIVKRSDLKFSDPPAVLGHGSFGFVLQAEYRGSKVAVKRALLPSSKGDSSSTDNVQFGTPLKRIGSQDYDEDSADSSRRRSTESTRSVDLEVGATKNRAEPQPALSTRNITASSKSMMMTKGAANSRKTKQLFMDEMRVLSTLRHPNITTMMGAVIDGSEPMLVMEFMEHGSLYEVLQNPTIALESDLILHIIQDIAQGTRFLHSSNPPVIHGDLKSGNILIDSKFRAKLSDFGMAKKGKRIATGTPPWMAPEVLSGKSSNTTKSDMYSIGVIMNEIVSRKEPYHATTDPLHVIVNGVTDPKVNRRPEIPSFCPVKVKKLIMFLWHADPKLRPTATELNNRLDDLNEQVFAACAPTKALHRPREVPTGGRDNFLYQAFPRHIADILSSGGKVEPEPHNDVSICFSDIVGFTTIASKLDPLKVSSLLDRLYLKFDEVTRKYDLFKVETVGDAYMCAGNLANDQHEDHVRRIALFATGICKAASETLIDEDDPSVGYLKIRVGFHCGPVVSNVVGSLNPRYGLFGDTVNVAARMESSGAVGRVHCTEECAKRLINDAPDLLVKARGATLIKGRGRMLTYWISEV